MMASTSNKLKNSNLSDKKKKGSKNAISTATKSKKLESEKPELKDIKKGEIIVSTVTDDFDFVDHYGDDLSESSDNLLPENLATSAISCGFIGVGGGGGKLAKAFLELGFNKTILINTTEKDQPAGVDEEHFLLLEGADGVGKDVTLGKEVLSDNMTVVEDTLKSKLGKVDWLFVLAGGGGGTGSACHVLHGALERYLKSNQASGTVVYVTSMPTAQEMLNPTIASNAQSLMQDVQSHPHIVLDNERQLQLLRGKVGMLDMYPAANLAFAKMISQILKLASEVSPIQSFDSKDLERCLRTNGRMFLGTTAVRDPEDARLGLKIFQSCLDRSPCPAPRGRPSTGTLLLVISPETASNPEMSNHMESAISYVGGRSETLFSGVYVREGLPALIAIMVLGGL